MSTRKDLEQLLDAIDSEGNYFLDQIQDNRVTDFVGVERSTWGSNRRWDAKERLTWGNIRRIKKIADAIGYELPLWFREMIAERRETSRREYRFTNGREMLTIDADFSQASCQISAKYDDGEWFTTPFQVADARHRPIEACRLVANWNG